MSEILDKALAHHADKEVNIIVVPEWDCNIYYSDLTLAEREKIEKHSRGNKFQMAAYTLIFKAKDQAGNNIFSLDNKGAILNSMDSHVVERIFEEMVVVESVEEAEKK